MGICGVALPTLLPALLKVFQESSFAVLADADGYKDALIMGHVQDIFLRRPPGAVPRYGAAGAELPRPLILSGDKRCGGGVLADYWDEKDEDGLTPVANAARGLVMSYVIATKSCQPNFYA